MSRKTSSNVVIEPLKHCSFEDEEAAKKEPSKQFDGGDGVAFDDIHIDVPDVVFDNVVVDQDRVLVKPSEESSGSKHTCVKAKESPIRHNYVSNICLEGEEVMDDNNSPYLPTLDSLTQRTIRVESVPPTSQSVGRAEVCAW